MFEVETGTGSETANSYATVQQFRDYWAQRGRTFSDSDATVEGWLIQATEYIDSQYQFFGTVSQYKQALEWPRINAMKRNYFLPYDQVPIDIVNATCYLAGEVKRRGGLVKIDDGVISDRIGPVSKTYRPGAAQVDFPEATRVLRYLIRPGAPAKRVN